MREQQNQSSSQPSLYSQVTDRIIAELERGIVPWVQPWSSGEAGAGLGLPRNARTSKTYSGINILLLWDAVIKGGYTTQQWLTFKQALELGGCVRKGEKGWTVCYADSFIPKDEKERASKEGGDPAAVAFDAVTAGKARGKDVVLVDTAGRLPTQLHLMEELKKIKRVVQKAESTSPHEVLLVIDGNTGQNALSQVKAFDDALQLTGLIVTKLDGTAKGGVLAAIALWAKERQTATPTLRPVPVYFIGVGEQLDDLETFNAREFAQALLA